MKSENTKAILIAEDEKAYRRALELKLGHEGYKVVSVEDGEQALESLKNHKYDLMLLDIIMPKVNGMTVLQEMNKANIKIPTLVMSNLTQEEDKQKAIALGVVGFVEKADTPLNEIVNNINKLLQ